VGQQARYLCHQAKDNALRYIHGAVGFNYALSNVSAAVGLAQVEQLPEFMRTKKANRARYADGVSGIVGLRLHEPPAGTDPNCWFYSLIVEPTEFGMDREELMQKLGERGIQTRPLWLPLHMQKPYRECRVISPERAVWYWERILNLPCSSDMTSGEVDRVVEAIASLARR